MSLKKLFIQYVDPQLLTYAPFNANVVSAENEERIESAIDRFGGMFKPILVRELDGGILQIIGGEHRNKAALRKKMDSVPIINLGRLSESRARELSLVDNGRYGSDDALKLGELLKSLEDASELTNFLPISTDEITALFASASIDLDALELSEDDELDDELATPKVQTHQVLRFRLALADAEMVTALIDDIMRSQNLTTEDALTNAGDALMVLLKLRRDGS